MEQNKDLFDEVTKETNVKEEPKKEIKKQENQLIDMGQKMSQSLIAQVESFTQISGETFNEKAKTFAIDIITGTTKKIVSEGYNWGEIDLVGCGFVNQIKRWSKLGVSMEDKLFIDIRNNNKTNMKDIQIKAQYQTIEKLMEKYCIKKIVRWKDGVICIGDEFETETDWETGLDKIVKFVKNKDIDRNKLENIIGAFKVAYIQNGDKIEQLVVEIDKNRILRGMNASASREKTVWNNDTQKMVLKTVTWEMWNNPNVRTFMKFPNDVVNDISVVEESEEMDWNKETKRKNVIDVQGDVINEVASGDKLEF